MTSRHRLILAPLVGLVLTGCVFMGWGEEAATLHALSDTSDMLVVGHLQPMPAAPGDGGILGRGTVAARRIVWGDAISFMMGSDAGLQEVPVIWITGQGEPPVGDWLWFLGGTGPGPRQLLGWTRPNRAGVLVRHIQIQMVLARLAGLTPAGGPLIEILLRNAYDRDIEMPEFRLLRGQLRLHPDVTIRVWAAGQPERQLLQPLPGRQVTIDPSNITSLISGEEHRLALDLEAIWGPQARSALQVTVEIKPYGEYRLDLSASEGLSGLEGVED